MVMIIHILVFRVVIKVTVISTYKTTLCHKPVDNIEVYIFIICLCTTIVHNSQ